MFNYKVWFASEEQKAEMIRFINEEELESCKEVIPYIQELEVGKKYHLTSNVDFTSEVYGFPSTTIDGYDHGINLFIPYDVKIGHVCCEVVE